MASNLKRKQTENPTCTCESLQNRPSNPSYSQKRHCSCCCCKQSHLPSLADTCQNFIKSKVPEKIMLYKQNEWSIFPETALKVLINGFKNEKSSVVVFTEGQTLRVDFLSMTAVNLKTLKSRSISWIDESGKCFFPPLFIDQDLESCSNFEPVIKCPKIRKTRKKEIEDNQERISTTDILKRKIKLVDPKSQIYNSIQASFSYGMGPFGQTSKIVHLHRYEPDDEVAKYRLTKFENNREGSDDVTMRYAWFGCGKKEMARVLIHGFDRPGMRMLTFMPADRAFGSVNQCDVDEKCGVQYMLLCRFMPNIPAEAGILRAKYYSISSLYSDSFVHPEYLLSFTLPPYVQEYLMGLNGIWLSDPPPITSFGSVPALPNSHAMKSVGGEKNKESGPVSPWLGLSNLYEAIQGDLSPISKELLMHHYHQFRKKEINREELVKKMRVIVGDKILKTTLTKLQCSPASWLEPVQTSKPVSGICDSSAIISASRSVLPAGAIQVSHPVTALKSVQPSGVNQQSQPMTQPMTALRSVLPAGANQGPQPMTALRSIPPAGTCQQFQSMTALRSVPPGGRNQAPITAFRTVLPGGSQAPMAALRSVSPGGSNQAPITALRSVSPGGSNQAPITALRSVSPGVSQAPTTALRCVSPSGSNQVAMGALISVPPGGASRESQPRGSSCSPIVLALVHESKTSETNNHGGASDCVSDTSRAEPAIKCIDKEKAVEGRSSSEPGTSRNEQCQNRKMPYYTIEQGMKQNNAAIDFLLRAAKLAQDPK